MRLARAIGLACGLVAFALALLSWAIASTGAALGTDLGVSAVAAGELQVGPGPVLRANGLQPGAAPATGVLRLRNIARVPLRVRMRALPSTRALDGVLALTTRHAGRRIELTRAWTARPFTLGVRESVALPLRARLLRPAQGLIADVTLEVDAVAVTRP